MITIIEGKGDADKNTKTFILLINLHNGNLYKFIYPSIDADTAKFYSEL